MIKYLLLSNLLFVASYLIYWVFLRKHTFFQLNRLLLLGILLGATLLPMVSLPLPDLFTAPQKVSSNRELPTAASDLNLPVTLDQPISAVPDFPLELDPDLLLLLPTFLLWVYWLSVLFMTARFCMQLSRLILFLRQYPKEVGQGFTLVRSGQAQAPFSFFRFIVIEKDLYEASRLDSILAHEKIHVRQWHSLDIMLTELFLIFFWLNPLAWHFRRTLELNLEYLTDHKMLVNGYQKKQYQYQLLELGLANQRLSMTMQFNHSSIKNRIKMMNLKPSPAHAGWRYLLFAPVLLAFLFLNSTTLTQDLALDDENPFYIFFTENASENEFILLQDYLLEQKIYLQVNHLLYNGQGKIKKLGLSLNVPNGNKCSFFDEADADESLDLVYGFKVYGAGFGTASLDAEELQKILAEFPTTTVMVLDGQKEITTASDLIVDRPDLEKYAVKVAQSMDIAEAQFRKRLEAENYQLSGGGSTTYEDLTPEKIELIKKKIADKSSITYFLDGLQRQADILEIAPEQITEVIVEEEQIDTIDPVTLKVIKTEIKTNVKVKRGPAKRNKL